MNRLLLKRVGKWHTAIVLVCTVSHSPVYSSERKGFMLNLNPLSSSRIIFQQNLSFSCMTWLQIKKALSRKRYLLCNY